MTSELSLGHRAVDGTCAPWPDHVLVIGAGRWARVIVGELCNKAPASVTLTVHSRHHIEEITRWLESRRLECRVRVSSGWPPPRPAEAAVGVIVANAARDHGPAARWALKQGFPTLVEKPIAPNADEADGLSALARANSARLAPAHVFLFASYINRFAEHIVGAGTPASLMVDWADPAAEVRYGETKRYDPRVAVYEDWLPHIVPVIGLLAGSLPDACYEVSVDKGGAIVELQMPAGLVMCRVRMERNAPKRRRVFRALLGRETHELDFSVEPGVISDGAVSVSADQTWETGERPLALMLNTFLAWAASGSPDVRLDFAPSLQACRITDAVRIEYRLAQKQWLVKALRTDARCDGVRYALAELLLSQTESSHAESIESKIDALIACFAGPDAAIQIQKLADARDIAAFVLDLLRIEARPLDFAES